MRLLISGLLMVAGMAGIGCDKTIHEVRVNEQPQQQLVLAAASDHG